MEIKNINNMAVELNGHKFLPIQAMREVFREKFPLGSIIIGCPSPAPESDGVSYVVSVEVFADNSKEKLPIFSRFVKINPGLEKAEEEAVEDPFNMVTRVAEYKAMEAVCATLPFSREDYLRELEEKSKKETGKAPTAEQVAFAASLPHVPTSNDKVVKEKAPAKEKGAVQNAVPSNSTPANQPAASQPVTAPEPKKAPAEPVAAKTKEQVKPQDPPEKEVMQDVQDGRDITWARSVVSCYRNTTGMTMGDIEEKYPKILHWFATSEAPAKNADFADMVAAAKIIEKERK